MRKDRAQSTWRNHTKRRAGPYQHGNPCPATDELEVCAERCRAHGIQCLNLRLKCSLLLTAHLITRGHSTFQHNTTQHNNPIQGNAKLCKKKRTAIQHKTPRHNTTQHNTTQHNTTQHNTTQHNTTQHNTTQHNTTQHNTTHLAPSRATPVSSAHVGQGLGIVVTRGVTDSPPASSSARRWGSPR